MCLCNFPGCMPASLSVCQSQGDEWSWQHLHLITGLLISLQKPNGTQDARRTRVRVRVMCLAAKWQNGLTIHLSRFPSLCFGSGCVVSECFCDLRGWGEWSPPVQVTSATRVQSLLASPTSDTHTEKIFYSRWTAVSTLQKQRQAFLFLKLVCLSVVAEKKVILMTFTNKHRFWFPHHVLRPKRQHELFGNDSSNAMYDCSNF